MQTDAKNRFAHLDNFLKEFDVKTTTVRGLSWNKAALLILFALLLCPGASSASGLDTIKERGELVHLGIPYANFVTGAGDGLSVELIQGFAEYLGVDYTFQQTDWASVFADLTGKVFKPDGDAVKILADASVKGDVIANGLTIIPWREKAIQFSTPTFPTQIWLVARADSPLQPIEPSGNLEKDIEKVRSELQGRTLLGKANTCLDPSLYDIDATGADVALFEGSLNDMAGAVIQGQVDATLLDVPDALVALTKWPGKIKVIGPLSGQQAMGVGFRKEDKELYEAFEKYFATIRADGTYLELVRKYYPLVFTYYPEFFQGVEK